MAGLQGGAPARVRKRSGFSCKWVEGCTPERGLMRCPWGESERSRGGENECWTGIMTSCLLSQLSWQQPRADNSGGGASQGLHSAKRQHRSCLFRKVPSPTLSATCFLSHAWVTGVSQGSVYPSPSVMLQEAGPLRAVLPMGVGSTELHPTLGDKALKFI